MAARRRPVALVCGLALGLARGACIASRTSGCIDLTDQPLSMDCGPAASGPFPPIF